MAAQIAHLRPSHGPTFHASALHFVEQASSGTYYLFNLPFRRHKDLSTRNRHVSIHCCVKSFLVHLYCFRWNVLSQNKLHSHFALHTWHFELTFFSHMASNVSLPPIVKTCFWCEKQPNLGTLFVTHRKRRSRPTLCSVVCYVVVYPSLSFKVWTFFCINFKLDGKLHFKRRCCNNWFWIRHSICHLSVGA